MIANIRNCRVTSEPAENCALRFATLLIYKIGNWLDFETNYPVELTSRMHVVEPSPTT